MQSADSSEVKKVSYFMGTLAAMFYAMAISAVFYGSSQIYASAFLVCATVWHVGNLVVSQIWRTK